MRKKKFCIDVSLPCEALLQLEMGKVCCIFSLLEFPGFKGMETQ